MLEQFKGVVEKKWRRNSLEAVTREGKNIPKVGHVYVEVHNLIPGWLSGSVTPIVVRKHICHILNEADKDGLYPDWDLPEHGCAHCLLHFWSTYI